MRLALERTFNAASLVLLDKTKRFVSESNLDRSDTQVISASTNFNALALAST